MVFGLIVWVVPVAAVVIAIWFIVKMFAGTPWPWQ